MGSLIMNGLAAGEVSRNTFVTFARFNPLSSSRRLYQHGQFDGQSSAR